MIVKSMQIARFSFDCEMDVCGLLTIIKGVREVIRPSSLVVSFSLEQRIFIRWQMDFGDSINGISETNMFFKLLGCDFDRKSV